MILYEYLRLMILSMPLGIFMTFGLLVVVTLSLRHAKIEGVFKRILFFYCLSAAIASFLLLTYYYRPLIFEQFDILYAGTVILAIVLFHHMLCFTIRFDKPFNIFHYISVVVVCGGMWLCKYLFPALWVVEGTSTLLIVALVFGVVHSLLTLVRVHEHQMKLSMQHQVADVLDKSKVVPFVVEIVLFPWTFAVCPLITGQNPGILTSLILMASILMALRMNIPLTYAMIRHYATPYNEASLLANTFPLPDVVVEEDAIDKPQTPQRPAQSKYSKNNMLDGVLIEIDKKVLEKYFRQHKPYLNPNLTIYDLVEMQESNRTYLSKFINEVYKMNFNSYVNWWRLREIEYLLALPQNEGKASKHLFAQAGFAFHRTYLRAKKTADENGVEIELVGQELELEEQEPTVQEEVEIETEKREKPKPKKKAKKKKPENKQAKEKKKK